MRADCACGWKYGSAPAIETASAVRGHVFHTGHDATVWTDDGKVYQLLERDVKGRVVEMIEPEPEQEWARRPSF